MKKLAVLALFLSFGVQAQVGQAETVEKTTLIGVGNKTIGYPVLKKVGSKDLYILTFMNYEYYPHLEEVESLAFFAEDEDLDYLYNTMLNQIGKTEATTFDLGDQKIMVSKMGRAVRFDILNSDQWFWVSKKQLKNLFNQR